MPNILKEIVSRIPGTTRRTVIEARYVDGNKTLATIRAGKTGSLNEYLGTAMSRLAGEPHPNGIVVFETDTIADIPVLGDVRLDTQPLGTSADGGYRRAIDLLTPGKPTDSHPIQETV